MFSKCTRKLMFRWALLTFVVGEIVMAVFWLVSGRLPVANALIITNPHNTLELPLVLSRVADPVFLMIPAALLVWTAINIDLIQHRWGERKGYGASFALVGGLFIGLCGSWVIAASGFGGIVWCTPVCSLLILIFTSAVTDGDIAPWQSFMTELAAVAAIWFLNTAYQGAIAGFVYAFSALVVAAVVHLGGAGLFIILKRASVPFSRTMLSCGVDEQ